MNAMVEEMPIERRLHLPRKVLGENFYPYMYGQYRCQRIQAMARARVRHGEERAALVKEARKLNHEGVWYLQRTERL